MSKNEYIEEVQNMLTSFGGFSEVIEKTVRFYFEKTGKWKLHGNDKYCKDAKQITAKTLNM